MKRKVDGGEIWRLLLYLRRQNGVEIREKKFRLQNPFSKRRIVELEAIFLLIINLLRGNLYRV